MSLTNTCPSVSLKFVNTSRLYADIAWTTLHWAAPCSNSQQANSSCHGSKKPEKDGRGRIVGSVCKARVVYQW